MRIAQQILGCVSIIPIKSIVLQDTEHGRLMVEPNPKGRQLWNVTDPKLHLNFLS